MTMTCLNAHLRHQTILT